MVGPNTMLAATPWIKRNMLNIDPEQEKKLPSEAEMRVKRCAEKLQVPDWYRNYFKPDTKFLKDKTPFECRPPTWKSMKGKAAAVNAVKKSRTPKKEPPSKLPSAIAGKINTTAKPTAQPGKSQPSPRKSLNSNYRISRKADQSAKNNKERLSISITPTSSDNESEQQPVLTNNSNNNNNNNEEEEDATLVNLSKSLRSPSNTFPRMHPSRKIQNINIVFPTDFTPKPPRRQLEQLDDEPPQASNESMVSSTPRTHYTLTKNIEVTEPALRPDDCNDSNHSSAAADVSQKSSYTSFLLAEVEPRGVTTTMQMFAGLDSDESDAHEVPARCSPSPHTRFFNSEKKSMELERIVQNSRENKRGNNLIREIIEELDRSIAESMASSRRSQESSAEISANQNFVKNVVRALESVSFNSQEDQDEYERSFEEDSELAKSTSISFKSSDDEATSAEDDEREEENTPMPTYQEYRHEEEQEEEEEKEEEQEEEEVYWIAAKIHDLARTSSRLSVMSRDSGRSGFQCTSGRCSPGLSPIKSDRARDEWTATLSSNRSRKTSPRQLFRIDETRVADSGCYSDRSGATSTATTRTPAFSDHESLSPLSSLSSSPTLADFDGITTDMLIKMSRPFVPLKSVRV